MRDFAPICAVARAPTVELEGRSEFSRFVDQEVACWNEIAKAADILLE